MHAHPDDAEMLAGGTLALLRDLGHAVVIVSMTAGDCGSATHSAEEIARIRRREAAEAAEAIGAEYRCGEFRDLAIFNTDEARRRVTELLRSTQPDIVLTASPIDYHCDHEATSVLVRDACFAASAPNYQTNAVQPAPALPAIPHLYYVDPVAGAGRLGETIEPDFLVDVGGTFDKKRAMLAKHASQRDWLRKQHGIDDYLETMERWTRDRGRPAGLEFGEGFRRYPGHPFPQTARLEGLLGPRVIVASGGRNDFP
jgi:LmbE family N-acetylglucosaminyl deacetylase